MNEIPIYTIGYGNRNFEEFILLIKKYGIKYVIDIRSKPYSKYNQDFSQNNIKQKLLHYKVQYVFMGKNLGGLPTNKRCFTRGRIDYSKVEKENFYKEGIERLKTAWNKNIPVVLMCTELKPEMCHRSKLIGQTLDKLDINVVHIDQNGNLKTQKEVISCITKNQLSFLEEKFMSRKIQSSHL